MYTITYSVYGKMVHRKLHRKHIIVICCVGMLCIYVCVHTDIDECALNGSLCDHLCNNTIGGFECLCNSSHFVLGSDGTSCFGILYCTQ